MMHPSYILRNKWIMLRYTALLKRMPQWNALDLLSARYGLESESVLSVVVKTRRENKLLQQRGIIVNLNRPKF